MMTATARTYSTGEAAAKAWAAPYRIVGRPGGFLHTPTAREYAELPDWLRGRTHFANDVQRLVDANGARRSIQGWTHLAAILMLRGIIVDDRGPRGGHRYRLASA